MNTFLKTYRLALTPLSPIHIGCGEDFEPTNYVIDDGVLYGFDPSRAVLEPRQRDELSKFGLNADLLGIQQFFRDNKQPFKIAADVLIPVSTGCQRVRAKTGASRSARVRQKRCIQQVDGRAGRVHRQCSISFCARQ